MAGARSARVQPRLEFRCFAPDLSPWSARLLERLDSRDTELSAALYLLWRDGDGLNVKIADQRLEIKDRIATEAGLERWRPREPIPFPLRAGSIDGLPALGDRQAMSVAAFIDACARAGHVLVHVLKTRQRFEADGLLAECCELIVNGCGLQTIAIEAGESAPVLRLRAELGLDDFESLAYPAMLRRVTGLAALPSASEWRADNTWLGRVR
ncbi:MAG: hypothetical protein R3E87_13495 [Burkholderiaceae bacterium]